jgi:hypothetical protein
MRKVVLEYHDPGLLWFQTRFIELVGGGGGGAVYQKRK